MVRTTREDDPMHNDEDAYLYMTEAERLALIVSHFNCEPQLAPAIRAYYRAIVAERSYARKCPEPGCCSMAHEHDGDTVRSYACISDFQGLVAIYRLRADGRFVRLTSWPQWIVELHHDPDRRAQRRRLEANSKRRDRVRMKRVAHQLMPKLLPPTPTPPAVRSNDNHKPAPSAFTDYWSDGDIEDLARILDELDEIAA